MNKFTVTIFFILCLSLSSCITLNYLEKRIPQDLWYPNNIIFIESNSFDLDFGVAGKFKIKNPEDIKKFVTKNNLNILEKKDYYNNQAYDFDHNYTIFGDSLLSLKNRIYYDEGNLYYKGTINARSPDEHWIVLLNVRTGELWIIHVAKDIA